MFGDKAILSVVVPLPGFMSPVLCVGEVKSPNSDSWSSRQRIEHRPVTDRDENGDHNRALSRQSVAFASGQWQHAHKATGREDVVRIFADGRASRSLCEPFKLAADVASEKQACSDVGIERRRRALVRNFNSDFEETRPDSIHPSMDERAANGRRDIQPCSEVSFGRAPSYRVRLDRQDKRAGNAQQSNDAQDPRYTCPPSRRVGSVCGLPIGAEIGQTIVLAGLAWLAFWRAFRPFSLLVIRRRDVGKGVAYAAVSVCLFGLSGWVWMLPG